MLLQYQDLYSVKSSDGLDLYCRLEGLDPMYTRSTMKAEERRIKAGKPGIMGRLFSKKAGQERRQGYGFV